MGEVCYYGGSSYCVRLDDCGCCYLTKSGDVWFMRSKIMPIPSECLWFDERDAELALEQYNRKHYWDSKPQEPDTHVQVDGKKVPVSKGIACKAVQMMEDESKPKPPEPVKVNDLEFSFDANNIRSIKIVKDSYSVYSKYTILYSVCSNYTILEAKHMIEALQSFVDFAENR